MKPSIIFKNKNGGKEWYAYIKYSVTEDGVKKVKLQSLNMNFPLSQIHWGGKNEKEKGKFELLRLQGKYIRATFENADDVNNLFSLQLDRVTNLSYSYGVITKFDFLGFLEKQIDDLFKKKKYGTRDSYITLKKDLNNFLIQTNRTRMLFPDITTEFVNDFKTYLEGTKNLKASTVSVRMYKFKAVYEKAISDDVYLPSKNVFYKKQYKAPKAKKGFLLPQEVEQLLMSKPLTNPVRGHYQEFDANGNIILQPIEKARLMFITQIFSNGMRVSDILFLRWNNLDFRDKHAQIKYTMYKTGEEMTFNLTNNLIWLLQHFVDSVDRFEDEKRPATKITCPKCESENIKSGGNYSHGKGVRQTLKCADCARTFQNVQRTEKKPELLTNSLAMVLKMNANPVGMGHPFQQHEPIPIKTTLLNLYEETGFVYFEELNKEILKFENFIEKGTQIDALAFSDLYRSGKLVVTDEETEKIEAAIESFKRGRRLSIKAMMDEYYEDKSEHAYTLFESHKNTYKNYLANLIRVREQYIKLKNDYLKGVFKRYSNEKPNSFIFQMLKDTDFKNVDGRNDFHNISPYQYLKYMNQSKRYNALLQKIRTHFDFKIPISTHTARYTFTYLMVEKNFDVYTISRLLGHSSISITDRYLPRFLAHKANQAMSDLHDSYDLGNIRKKDAVEAKSVKDSIDYIKDFM
ncbi:tyrosine-type recombinase/integrase [Mucilaginibacter achroorhodeus]|uniref:Tyrosine-type recombinase/integrase n=1 Tax=Mucilaginibacter achroorhodeus TaxID=2599294 RepID=A0A563U6E3_9SPHI|nr:tyrosine-type recombinase/integrase [Mucilaginibacter achroorhodeus]TWR26926.1 tyrosine-type recombinase/integrase [Mucilaginibacter achroorhodeus]